jgi:hypothetical protein
MAFMIFAPTMANAQQRFLERWSAQVESASAKRSATFWPTLVGTPDVINKLVQTDCELNISYYKFSQVLEIPAKTPKNAN